MIISPFIGIIFLNLRKVVILLKCPFCNHAVAKNTDTYLQEYINFYTSGRMYELDNDFIIEKLKCPECHEISYKAIGLKLDDIGTVNIRPKSRAMKFPEYIPQILREDYEEAHSIVDLSPKASATLARRCLQGILRDFYDAKGKNLNEEIKYLEDKIPALQYSVLHSVRKIGNIGAHMEKDVNVIIDISSEEASKLLSLIEHLFKVTYIDKHEAEKLMNEINGISEEKSEMKKTQ